MEFAAAEFFRVRGACQPALDWFAGRDVGAAWAECERGSWMLWVLDQCPSVSATNRKSLALIVAGVAVEKSPAEDRKAFGDAVQDVAKAPAVEEKVSRLKSSDPLSTGHVVGVAIESVLKLLHDKPTDGRILERSGYTMIQFATRDALKNGDPKAVAVARDSAERELANTIRNIWPTAPVDVPRGDEKAVPRAR